MESIPQVPYIKSPLATDIDWTDAIKSKFLKKVGEHLLEIGITGSGKTQGLYHLLLGILEYSKDETILWISCGKSSEELTLMRYMPCNFLYPQRRSFEIKLFKETYPYTSYEFLNIPEIFNHIDKGKINILCLAPYFPDPEEYAIVITEFFKDLIKIAKKGTIPTPLAIFIDEFQMVAPAQGQALNDQHSIGGRWMQRNLDQLRSIGIRIVAAAQAWKKVRQGVRTSFGCIMIRQGAEFPANEIKRLAQANDTWQALGREDMVFAFRNRFYSDPIKLPSYGDGYEIGTIEFIDSTERNQMSTVSIDELLEMNRKPERKQKTVDEDD